MNKKVYFNGRFLSQSITGVQRTAYELIKAFDELLYNEELNSEYEFILIHPVQKINPIALKKIKLLPKGILKGNLWEQFELPYYTRNSLLISFCMISSLFKKKQLVFIHDACCFAKPQFFSTAFRLWYKFAIPILGNMSLKIITVSNFSKSELHKYANINPDKISVIYNAANHVLNYNGPSSEFKTKVDNLKPYVLAVSSLNPNKNFNAITKAMEATDLSVNVVLAGATNIKSFGSTNFHSSAHHMGYVSDDELKYLYTEAELFIYPSFYEGFGIPPLEAMMLGCPVLTSNTSALPEVLGNACMYCNPYSENSIKDGINYLLNNYNTLSMLRSKGFEQAYKYSWTQSAKQLYNYIELYA